VVSGEAILGANMFRDFFANVRDVAGGRSAGYEKELRRAEAVAMEEMIEQARERGATAFVGVDLDYEALGQSMLMVVANGTAVRTEEQRRWAARGRRDAGGRRSACLIRRSGARYPRLRSARAGAAPARGLVHPAPSTPSR
jgi:uncharacterized protein YbjQ (UPF0145 family)